jgi:isopenicillin-N N-acyltransferase-like protein
MQATLIYKINFLYSMSKEIKVYEISGNAHDLGFQHGEIFKADIDKFVNQFYEIYGGFKVSKEKVLNKASHYVPYIENYSPEIMEEIKGIAEGSDKTINEIAMLVAYYEIYDLLAFPGNCTAFGISPLYSKNKEVFIGQNWDDDNSWYWNGDMPRLLKKRRKAGPDLLAYIYPGFPNCAGMNSDGIGLVWNTMHCEKNKVGVPTYVILADILHQKRIGDALGSVIRAERADSFNFMIGSKEGEVYNVEANPDSYDLMYVEKGFGHANHFVSDKIPIQKDTIVESLADTVVRHYRMNKLVEMNAGQVDLDTCKKFLSDHVNYPYSICRHPTQEFPFLTFDSIILALSKGEMWVSHGNPCEVEYKKFTF